MSQQHRRGDETARFSRREERVAYFPDREPSGEYVAREARRHHGRDGLGWYTKEGIRIDDLYSTVLSFRAYPTEEKAIEAAKVIWPDVPATSVNGATKP